VDTSDETFIFTSCYETEFFCNKSRRCISRDMVLDGNLQCSDGSDEVKPLTCNLKTEFQCLNSGRCIPRYRVNDGFRDCENDENFADFKCIPDLEYDCKDGRCIPISWVGDSLKNCNNGEDEKQEKVKCNLADHFACKDQSRCLPLKYLCDGSENCGDASDEIDLCEHPTLFTCFDNPKIKAPWSATFQKKHSSLQYCPDNSESKALILPGFKCQVSPTSFSDYSTRRSLIPQLYIEKNFSVCVDQSDRCIDDKGMFICARCFHNNTIIATKQICDGIIDCLDLSDECVCENSPAFPLCNEAFHPKDTKIKMSTICNGVVDYPNGLDEKFCDYVGLVEDNTKNSGFYNCRKNPLIHSSWSADHEAKFCDGIVDCPWKDDECSSECRDEIFRGDTNRSPIHYENLCLKDQSLNVLCGGITYLYDDVQRLRQKLKYRNESLNRLMSTDIHNLNIVADYEGLVSKCFQRIDEYCDQTNNCDWRFDCKLQNGSQTIELSRVCDYAVDCNNTRDELVCPKTSHFKCWSGKPVYIRRHKCSDGVADCEDKSDECVNDEFSSPYEMIKDNFLRHFVWVGAIVIIIANLIVICKHLQKLKYLRDRHSMPYINTTLITHLATSDLLMGVSLILVGIKSSIYSGKYCYYDYQWRTSHTCNLVGVLTVVASQTSMNILVLMTGLRVFVTLKPFSSNQINYKFCHFLAFSAWLSSFIFALIPIFNSDLFTKAYLIKSSPYFLMPYVKKSALNSYLTRTDEILKWQNYSEINSSFLLTNNSLNQYPKRSVIIEGRFGYYSSSGVCFPDLYSRDFPEFSLSFTVIIYNFFALLFIAISYIFIYARSTQNRMLGTENQRRLIERANNTLKRRVIYIIVTDAMSWIPIIIMAFLSYSSYTLPESAHSLSAIVLLPINSAINPIIYSRFDQIVKTHFKTLFHRTKIQNQESMIRGTQTMDTVL